MEANENKSNTFFQKSQQMGHYRRWKFFQFLNILRNVIGYQITRNYIKGLKDGEEQRNSPSYADASYASQVRLVPVLKRKFWAQSSKIKSFSYVGHISTPHYGI